MQAQMCGCWQTSASMQFQVGAYSVHDKFTFMARMEYSFVSPYMATVDDLPTPL